MSTKARPRCARLHVEALEERAQPSTSPMPELVVDASSYDSTALLLHIEVGAEPAAAVHDLGDLEHLGFGIWKLDLNTDTNLDEAWTLLEAMPGVVELDLDYSIQINAVPNDPGFSQQYGLGNISAPAGWDFTVGSRNVIVAVIDTGVDYNHPDLINNIWRNTAEIAGNGIDDDGNGYRDDIIGWDFYDDDNNPYDSEGHGTHVAGTIAAVGNNGTGVTGVAWNVQIMPLRFLGPQGGFTSDAVRALNYAVDNGATISNNSWGGGGFSRSLQTAIAGARNSGHIFVAAAGNEGVNNDLNPHYPSNYTLDNIIAVAATDQNDRLASFSNYGASSVDLGAPGVSILSTTPNNSYSFFSGTSMAAPHVTGAIALVRSLRPDWNYQQVISAVLNNVDQVSGLTGVTATGGRLNVFAALRDAAENATPSPSPLPGNGGPTLADSLANNQAYTIVGATGSSTRILSVKIFDDSGNLVDTVTPFDHLTSLRVATGDFDGDGRVDEFAVLGRRTGSDLRAEIVTYDLTVDGQAVETNRFFAFDEGILGNGFLAAGDFDGDGFDDIAVGQIGGGRAMATVQIHANFGAGFFRAGSVFVDFGVVSAPRLGAGDIDGDGFDEIVVVARTPDGAGVLVLDATDFMPTRQGAGFLWDFGIAGYARGAFVAVGEFDPTSIGEEIVLGSNVGGGGRVDVVSYDGVGVATLVDNGRFTPFDNGYNAAVRVAVGQLNDRAVIVAGQDRFQSGQITILARQLDTGLLNAPFERVPTITALTDADGLAPDNPSGSRILGPFVAFANDAMVRLPSPFLETGESEASTDAIELALAMNDERVQVRVDQLDELFEAALA